MVNGKLLEKELEWYNERDIKMESMRYEKT